MSSVGFFRSGVKIECLKESGKVPVLMDRLIIVAMVGDKTWEHFFRRKVGRGSRSHCLSGECDSSFSISSTVTGSKLRSFPGCDAGVGSCGERGCVWFDEMESRSLAILSWKNEPKREGSDGDGEGSGEDCFRWRTLLTVFQSWRGFPREEAIWSE